jgi:hypothetical protein
MTIFIPEISPRAFPTLFESPAAEHLNSFSVIQGFFGRCATKNIEGAIMNKTQQHIKSIAILTGSEGEFGLCPTVMTEEELIQFLRIPEISNSKSHRNVIENLKRTRGLPRIHLCGKRVYLTDAVKAWLENLITCSQ